MGVHVEGISVAHPGGKLNGQCGPAAFAGVDRPTDIEGVRSCSRRRRSRREEASAAGELVCRYNAWPSFCVAGRQGRYGDLGRPSGRPSLRDRRIAS